MVAEVLHECFRETVERLSAQDRGESHGNHGDPGHSGHSESSSSSKQGIDTPIWTRLPDKR